MGHSGLPDLESGRSEAILRGLVFILFNMKVKQFQRFFFFRAVCTQVYHHTVFFFLQMFVFGCIQGHHVKAQALSGLGRSKETWREFLYCLALNLECNSVKKAAQKV